MKSFGDGISVYQHSRDKWQLLAIMFYLVILVFNLKKLNDRSPTQNWPNHQLHGQTNHTVIRELIWAVFMHGLHQPFSTNHDKLVIV